MSLINCDNLRFTVAFIAGLFVLGLALQIPRALLSDLNSLVILMSGAGLLVIVLSPIVLISTMLVGLLPGVSRRLDDCNR
jgi:hypothetical protein